jgi:hypothetical protein
MGVDLRLKFGPIVYGAIFFRIHIWSNSLRRPRLKFVFLIFYFDSKKNNLSIFFSIYLDDKEEKLKKQFSISIM